MKLCVYCGSGPGHNPAYMAEARALGRLMAKERIGLVWGGGANGIMGEVARAVVEAGGHVIGVIPDFLGSREHKFEGAQEMHVVSSMHERKQLMFDLSDGFVALPGGIGTLEELAEILTWSQLARHAKPVILCNTEGYWDPLLSLFAHMREEGFIRPGMEVGLTVATEAAGVVRAFRERLPKASAAAFSTQF